MAWWWWWSSLLLWLCPYHWHRIYHSLFNNLPAMECNLKRQDRTRRNKTGNEWVSLQCEAPECGWTQVRAERGNMVLARLWHSSLGPRFGWICCLICSGRFKLEYIPVPCWVHKSKESELFSNYSFPVLLLGFCLEIFSGHTHFSGFLLNSLCQFLRGERYN